MLLVTTVLHSGCGDGGGGAEPLAIYSQAGRGRGELVYPRAIVAAADCFYVVDKTARIQAFDFDGQYLRGWRTPEWEAGKPVGLGVGPDGRVYVADTHYGRVLIYSAAGELLDQFGSYGDAPGQMRLPTDVAIDPQGDIIVAEYGGNDRINRFDPDFTHEATFADVNSGDARVIRPQGIAFDAAGWLWVTDAFNHRILRLDRDGRLQQQFGALGTGLGKLRYPYAVDFLSDGTLVVAEYGNNRVQRFTRDGESLGVWGHAGRKPGQLAGPWGLAVIPGDRILIADAGNNRIQVIAGDSERTWRRDPNAPGG